LASEVVRHPRTLALLSVVDVYGRGSLRVITPFCTVGLLVACIEVSLATHRRKFWLARNGTRLDVPLSTGLWSLQGNSRSLGVFTTHLTCLEVEPDNWPEKQHLASVCKPIGPWRLPVMDHEGAILILEVDADETRSRLYWGGVPLRLHQRLREGRVGAGEVVQLIARDLRPVPGWTRVPPVPVAAAPVPSHLHPAGLPADEPPTRVVHTNLYEREALAHSQRTNLFTVMSRRRRPTPPADWLLPGHASCWVAMGEVTAAPTLFAAAPAATVAMLAQYFAGWFGPNIRLCHHNRVLHDDTQLLASMGTTQLEPLTWRIIQRGGAPAPWHYDCDSDDSSGDPGESRSPPPHHQARRQKSTTSTMS
jgi:hypothetical protein